MQYLWGTRYIDDIIMHREDGGGDSRVGIAHSRRVGTAHQLGVRRRTEVQFSTMAVLNDNAVLQERIAYDPYGQALHHDDKDIDGDRDFDQNDRDIIDTIVRGGGANIEDAAYNVDADLNRDGAIDSTDQSTANNATDVSALATGELSNATVKNTIGWDGYVFNPECGLYLVRFRWYSTELGRWATRDPAGYVDSMNLFEHAVSSPVVLLDPIGLFADGIPSTNEATNSNSESAAGATPSPGCSECKRLEVWFIAWGDDMRTGTDPDGDTARLKYRGLTQNRRSNEYVVRVENLEEVLSFAQGLLEQCRAESTGCCCLSMGISE